MQRMKTSFATFALVTNKKQAKAKQNISVKTGVLIRGDLQKCLLCSGIATISKGKVSSFYPKTIQYPHLEKCVNEGRF